MKYAYPPKQTSRLSPDKKQGFAVIIALSLMSFIVLLLLSMTTLVRVETQTAIITKEQLVAKQNASLGAYIALGELQQHAGPDQRVTARADILRSTSDPDKAHWTGVWSDPNPDDPTNSPTLERWLVSGDTPDPTSGNSADSLALITVASGLVDDPSKEVYVDTVDITNISNTVEAQYAFWVSDEGVKAKLNLTDNYRETTDSSHPNFAGSVDWDHLVTRSHLPQRTGIERLTAANNVSPTQQVLDTLEKQSSLSDLEFLVGQAWADIPEKHFHDATTSHFGVISNVRDGGLKRDLSRGLYEQSSRLTGTLFDVTPYPNEPSWSILQSYAQTQAPILSNNTPSIIPRPHILNQVLTDTSGTFGDNPFKDEVADASLPDQHGFAPVIYEAALEIWYRFIQDPAGSIATDGSPNYRLELAIQPVFTLANPYSVEMACPEMRVIFDLGMDGSNGGYGFPAVGLEYTWVELLGGSFASDVGAGGLQYRPLFNFIIPATDFGPGEVKQFTRGGPDANASGIYDGPLSMQAEWGAPLERVNNHLAEGLTGGGTLFRLPHASPELISENELTSQVTFWNGSNQFREINSAGKNITVHLEVFDSGRPPNEFGPPLSRIEIISVGAEANFPKTNGAWWVSPLDSSINTKGRGILAHNIALQNRTYMPKNSTGVKSVSGAINTDNQIYWLRDHNIRYPFYSDANGAGTPGGDPRRNFNLYARSENYVLYEDSFQGESFQAQILGGTNDAVGSSGMPDGRSFLPLFNVLTVPLQTIAQLQHANLVANDRFFTDAVNTTRANANLGGLNGRSLGLSASGFPSVGIGQPSYVVGHSTRDPSVAINNTNQDFIYQTNRALWDDFFVSTMTQDYALADLSAEMADSGATDELLNKRFRLYSEGLNSTNPSNTDLTKVKDIDTAAAHRLIDGAFNINSTSVEAWRAILSSLNDMTPAVAPHDSNSMRVGSALANSFPNFSTPNADSPTSDTLGVDATWQSHISLTDQEVIDLSESIVARLKERQGAPNGGPFMSLADFINRLPGEEAGFLDKILQPEWFASGSDDAPLAWTSGDSVNEPFISEYEASVSSPGVLHQANLLQAIGSYIQARSDTFKIWSYGNSLNPLNGDLESESLLEITVQRVPDFVDDASDNPETAISALTSTTNKNFGRRFRIVSIKEHSI